MDAKRIIRTLLAAAIAAAGGARAAGEVGGAGTVYPKEQYPYGELVRQPLTLAAGVIEVNVPVEVNLTPDEVGEPWFIPASGDFGYTDDLQLGIFHQIGICLSGEAGGCPSSYDDLGGRIRLGVHRDPGEQLALQGGVMASSFESSLYDAYVGAAYKRTMGNLALVLEANLSFALNDRNHAREPNLGGIRGVQFGEAFLARADLQIQLMPGFAAFGGIGYATSLEEPEGDAPWLVPVGFGAEYEVFPRFGVGAEFTFENLLGEESDTVFEDVEPPDRDSYRGTIFARLFL